MLVAISLVILLGAILILAVLRLHCFSLFRLKDYEQCEVLMLSDRKHNVCVRRKDHNGPHKSVDKLTF